MKIRLATWSDLDALAGLEKAAFSPALYHLTSRRSYRHLLTKGHAEIWVIDYAHRLCAMCILLYRKGSRLGRLYSIAVAPDLQGGTYGQVIFQQAETAVEAKGLQGLSLEIRADNQRHYERYCRIGFSKVGILPHYYPDDSAAIKMKKYF